MSPARLVIDWELLCLALGAVASCVWFPLKALQLATPRSLDLATAYTAIGTCYLAVTVLTIDWPAVMAACVRWEGDA